MNSSSAKSIEEEVKISFSGLDADKGVVDVIDLTRALNGWREYWDITFSVYLNKELSTKPLPLDIRPQIKIRALERRSFDVLTVILIPVALMVGYDIVKYLWKWRKSLVRTHIESKRKFLAKEEALEALQELAQRFEIESTTTMEALKVIDIVDDALNGIVEPLDRSAKRIVITSTSVKSTLQFTSADKRALKSGYYVDTALRSKGFDKFSVKFIRINTETGNALITFDNPTGIHQMGHEYSKIIDPRVSEPRNIYTRAFYEGSSLEVWGRIVRSQTSHRFVRWEITATLPAEDTPLFDNNGEGTSG
ncbi:hypothetical protein ES703_51660 [subsurface metagenome]